MDIVIEDAFIVDGRNVEPYVSDIGIQDEKIVAIKDLKRVQAKRRVNAKGLVVTPGFVDCHCHSDAIIFTPQKNPLRLMQGITTEIIGNCGITAAPVHEACKELVEKYCDPIYAHIKLPYNWYSFKQYLDAIEACQPILNVAALVGHGTIRANVLGFDDRLATPVELMEMETLLDRCLKEGAIGLSTGLVYPPGFYSDEHELVSLAKVVANHKAIYTTHMRSETNEVVESLKQSIEITRKTNVNLEVSHLKASGMMNHGKSKQLLGLIHEAIDEGLSVGFDVYPYTAASTQFCAVLPPFMQEGGTQSLLKRLASTQERAKAKAMMLDKDANFENVSIHTTWDKIIISQCSIQNYENKSVKQIAQELNIDEFEATFEILLHSNNQAMMIVYLMDEKDVETIIQDKYSIIASDGIPSLDTYHPRYLGTFIRVLDYYVKTRKLMSLQEAIHKMTYKPAKKFNIQKRGCIKEGYYADLVVFDFDKLQDNTTYEHCSQIASGIKMVIMNGQIAVEDNEYLNVTAGKVIRNEDTL